MIEKLKIYHPFIQRESKVLFGNFVTLDQGSGVVHIAPGHGMEDTLSACRTASCVLSCRR